MPGIAGELSGRIGRDGGPHAYHDGPGDPRPGLGRTHQTTSMEARRSDSTPAAENLNLGAPNFCPSQLAALTHHSRRTPRAPARRPRTGRTLSDGAEFAQIVRTPSGWKSRLRPQSQREEARGRPLAFKPQLEIKATERKCAAS